MFDFYVLQAALDEILLRLNLRLILEYIYHSLLAIWVIEKLWTFREVDIFLF